MCKEKLLAKSDMDLCCAVLKWWILSFRCLPDNYAISDMANQCVCAREGVEFVASCIDFLINFIQCHTVNSEIFARILFLE